MAFQGPIVVEALPGSRWRLVRGLTWSDDRFTITVPPDFITDFGSVPWLATALVPRSGDGLTGAYVVHDWLYRVKRYSRREADQIMRRIMAADGVGPIRRGLAWLGVRLGGWLAW